MVVYELNLDGLVGPTHHYAGLSTGNLASTTNALQSSNPQAAALQGLAKMRLLHEMGLKQAVLPPHERPNLNLLVQLGFSGTAEQILTNAMKTAPELLSAVYSASSMWAANAATVSASLDTADARIHFTAANLISNLHRAQETSFSSYLLARLFADELYFNHHQSLPCTMITTDEGAANHCRLAAKHGEAGVQLFVYGKKANHSFHNGPIKYPARQTFEASKIIARSHQLDLNQVVFACQNPQIIDQGVFHNDVIAVTNESVLLAHEEAFIEQDKILATLQQKSAFPLKLLIIESKRISVADAVNTYLFNSQLVTLSNGNMALIAPVECSEHLPIKTLIEEWISDSDNPITQVHYVDLKQSMRNGGGPACLRLRVPMNNKELAAMHQGVLVSDTLLMQLESWVKKNYRDRLNIADLADPNLLNENLSALDELTQILQLDALYPFQKNNI